MFKLKYTAILLCVLLCSSVLWHGPTQATATEDLTLTVEYIYEETAIPETEVDIYLVASWVEDSFILTEAFQEVGIDFSISDSPSLWREEAELIVQYIADTNCDPTASQATDETGCTSFADLESGVYYVRIANTKYEDETLLSSPILITLPLYTSETNTYTYDVVMAPKMSVDITPTTPTTPTTPSVTPTPTPEGEGTPEDPSLDIPENGIPLIYMENDPLADIPEGDVPLTLVIFDQPIPLTGTTTWVILPLALVGVGLVLFALIALRKKDRKV